MKYAFMTFSCPDLSLGEVLALARETGYDGVEPRLGSGHGHGVETSTGNGARRAIREAFEDAGVACACLALGARFARDQDVAAGVEETRAAIGLAGDIGCPRLRVFGGAIGEQSREAAVDRAAAALAGLAEPAADRGVTICLETHDDWCDPADVAALMQRVDHPSIAVNWDIMHPVRRAGKTMEEAFTTLRPWIRHVHFHDGREGEKLEFAPIGEGFVDHAAAVRCLAGIGYDGYLSGEWINWEDPYEVHLPRELRVMKGLEG